MKHTRSVRSPLRLFAAALVLFLLVPALALGQETATIRLEPMNGSQVNGTIILTANGDATDATIDLTGLPAGAEGRATLYANTCEQPSASFAPIATFTAGADGTVH